MKERPLPPNLACKRLTNRQLVAGKVRRNGAGDAKWPGGELVALAKAIAKMVDAYGSVANFSRKCGLPESTVRMATDPRVSNPRLSTLLVMARAARHQLFLRAKEN